MLETIKQSFIKMDFLSEGWIIFYTGLVFAFLVWLLKWLKKRFTRKLSVFEGEIYDLNFPTSDNTLIGRENAMKELDKAWEDQNTRLMVLVAGPGTGKTILVKNWLEQLKLHRDENAVQRIYCWSFQNQGIENKHTASSNFFRNALAFFKSDKDKFNSEYNKGVYLAKLINTQRTLVVLDGLEVFQPWHHSEALRGGLNDNAITGLLKTLAMQNSGLCLVTMREHLDQKVAKMEYARQYPLKNLSMRAAVQLLKGNGVQGKDAELDKVAREYKGHAYSLNLLATYLKQNYQGDIRQRDRLPNIMHRDETDEINYHIQQVMQAYADSLNGYPELALLYLISLFDQAVEKDLIYELIAALAKLYQTPIRKLAAKSLLQNKTWVASCKTLQAAGLLTGSSTDWLDVNPLVRDFFRGEFQTNYPSLWRRAHIELYEYYKALPEDEQPNSVEEMQPLFHAVAHGCMAGLHQKVLREVYHPRILRNNDNFLWDKLGAYSDDLAALAHFFSQPWDVPISDFTEADQVVFLNWAGFSLRALGRMEEAMGPMLASFERSVNQENWKSAATNANNLSELQLILGQVPDAASSGECSVGYADQSGEFFARIAYRTSLADCLRQAGQLAKAIELLVEAEQIQQEYKSQHPLQYRQLHSLRDFLYCDLMLTQGNTIEARRRSEDDMERKEKHSSKYGLLDFSLPKLSLGRVFHAQNDLSSAYNWLNQAVASLREAGTQQYLPLGLLARASLYRDLNEYTLAQQDLAEVWEIVEPSGMRLHTTDYHLEMARLLLKNPTHSSAEEKTLSLADHINAAETLINETGYHRRDDELAALKNESTH